MMKIMMNKHNWTRFASFVWAIAIVIGSLPASLTTHATTLPYNVTFTLNNFRLPILSATLDDVSDPSHPTFTLQNGAPLWYSIAVQSTTDTTQLTPADSATDLVSTTFFTTAPLLLLPPVHVLPFDQWNGSYHFAALKLKTAFTGPNQQLHLELTPIEPHAVALDVVDMLVHLLGQNSDGAQVGLLAPGILKNIFDSTTSMPDFTALVDNYTQVLQSVPDSAQMLAYAYTCATNLVALLTNPTEQAGVIDLLWRVQGKVIPRSIVSRGVSSFAQAEFGLASEAFIKDQALAVGLALFGQNNPVVQLATVSISQPTRTPSPSPTTTITPSPTPDPVVNIHPTLTPVQTPIPK